MITSSTMAPYTSNKTPRSAYHLYFRFYRNILQCPSLQMNSIQTDKTQKDLYKSYVKMVLNTEVDDLPVEKDAAHQKFFGSDSFAGMSKKVSQKWKEADALTRSVFKEIAKEDRERYKRELFDSYQAFTRDLSTSVPVTAVNLRLARVQPRWDDAQVQVHSTHKIVKAGMDTQKCEEGSMNRIVSKADSSVKDVCRSAHDRIKEVDISDEEIISMAIAIWVPSPDEPNRNVYQPEVSFSTPKGNDVAVEEELGEFLLALDWD
ncbi:hypothetical protein HJC23_001360 [Cyclotella cryptica]|uniref:HMG box domain-containing protein n=1 Tax=Cyclotella cryptica TaxID=29204 RepID=A0ABD3PNN8_9STRA